MLKDETWLVAAQYTPVYHDVDHSNTHYLCIWKTTDDSEIERHGHQLGAFSPIDVSPC